MHLITNQDQIQINYGEIPSRKVKELASKDGAKGVIAKAVIKAYSGMLASVANVVGTTGLEKIATPLSTVAPNITDLAPTDLGSSAVNLLVGDIGIRITSDKLTFVEGSLELFKLLFTDVDFVSDLLAVVFGASAGGGGVSFIKI